MRKPFLSAPGVRDHSLATSFYRGKKHASRKRPYSSVNADFSPHQQGTPEANTVVVAVKPWNAGGDFVPNPSAK